MQQPLTSEFIFHSFTVTLAALSLGIRLHNIGEPSHVCWDEVHFGKFASYYINRTLFVDVHPPLGKLILAAAGLFSGYNGEFSFEKPGDSLSDVDYIGMRQAAAFFGSLVVPLSSCIVWESTSSALASALTGALVLADTALTTISRYILLDPFLHCFILLSYYCFLRQTKCSSFSTEWWIWNASTGIFLACAVSVKFVGLFMVLLIGLRVVRELRLVAADRNVSLESVVRFLLAKVYALIGLPVLTYCWIFAVHFVVLSKSGPGDGFFSSLYQTTLLGNPLFHVRMPEYVAYGSLFTLKNYRVAGGYLHSHVHLYPQEVGPPHQQVTTYLHKDKNNVWLIKRPDDAQDLSEDIQYVKDGDIVRLEHNLTRRNLHSHDHPAPITTSHRQVSCYGQSGVGDTNDLFKVKVVYGIQDLDRISPIITVFQLEHVNEACVLQSKGKKLPRWASEQYEVTCNPDLHSSHSHWNVEQLWDQRQQASRFDWKDVRPGFLGKFKESNLIMFASNANLQPKEEELWSRPWMWPLAYHGQLFSANPHILMLGNPVIYWLIALTLLISVIVFLFDAVMLQRSRSYTKVEELIPLPSVYSHLAWFFLGWFLHYAPFWTMSRVVYPHHYLAAFLFSCMYAGVFVDYIVLRMLRSVSKHGASLHPLVITWIILSVLYSFYLFSPLVYGYETYSAPGEDNPMLYLQWLPSWDF